VDEEDEEEQDDNKDGDGKCENNEDSEDEDDDDDKFASLPDVHDHGLNAMERLIKCQTQQVKK